MTKKGVVLTEVLFLLGLVSVSAAALAARDEHYGSWVAWLIVGGFSFGAMRYRDAHPPTPDVPTLWERVILVRPVIDLMLAYRFWTAMASHENPDFRERVLWASGVMMARGAHAKNIGFPCQVTLTERNMAKPEKASRASPEAAQQPDENTTQSVTQ
jgi:hypothetical protein